MNPLSRRRFLVTGGLMSGALVVAAGFFMRGGGDAHYASLLPGATPEVLSLKELGVLAAFCDRVCPQRSESEPGPRETRVAERIDRELGFHTLQMQSDVKAALLLLEHGGVLHFDATRFTRLSPHAQDAWLQRMAVDGNALERQVFGNLKLLSVFFHYCDERTWKGVRYDGPFQPRKAPPADSRVRS